MLNDAKEAPDLVRKVLTIDSEAYAGLGTKLRELNPACIATIARGSSDHAASYASYLFPLCTGKIVASIAPSLVTVLKAPLNLKNQFALVISQSGRSPDIISTHDCVQSSGALTAAIINDVASTVAKKANFLLPQHAGHEGIAATKSVLCTMTSIARVAAEWTNDAKLADSLKGLPEALSQAFEAGSHLDAKLMSGISNVYVLSRGLGLAAAQETALKLKETCGVHAEAFSAAEVRHGPREIVDGKFMVVALALPGSGKEDVIAAAEELRSQGARVLLLDDKLLPEINDYRLAPLVVLQLLYPWLARSSEALGHDPDRPRTLKSKVIQTI